MLNSAVYLVSLTQQVSTFALNYQGRPFREGLTENPALYYGLLGVAGVAINGALDIVPEFNSWLQLTNMPWDVSLFDHFHVESVLSFRLTVPNSPHHRHDL